MSNEEIVIITYYLLLAPYKKLPLDLGMTNPNIDFWEFMRKYSTWPQKGLSYLNIETGKFDNLGYKT